jgi:RNA polymerase sigma-70 factor (ECF subfamily)
MADTAVDETVAELNSRSDAELLHLSRGVTGEAAFRELYRRHHGAVRGFLARLLRDAQAAEDVLQETFLRVHLHRGRHDPSLPFRPWLFRIARNLGLNALEARKPTGRSPGDAVAANDAVPVAAARRESRDATREALDALPDEMRALLIQRHGLGMTLDELASSWELNERTIRTRLQAAVDELTRALILRREVSRDDV